MIGFNQGGIPYTVVILSLSFVMGCAQAEYSNSGDCKAGSSLVCVCSDGTESVEGCADDPEYSQCQCISNENAIVASDGFGGAAANPGDSDDVAEFAAALNTSEDTDPTFDSEASSDGPEQIIASGGDGLDGAELDEAGTEDEPSDDDEIELERFSFFLTSLEALQRLSGNQKGFGGDLRYGEADGLSGADKICTEIAEYSMPGAGRKGWRAFLSATKGGPEGGPVHAIERIGPGPWYDRLGRVLAMTVADLVNVRPLGADPEIIDDLPNEYGVPNHTPDGVLVDNHHVLTGSNQFGALVANDPRLTCQDWSSSVGTDGTPTVGMSWPRMGGGVYAAMGGNWISDHNEAGCAPVDFSAIADSMGGPRPGSDGVGSGGGYGGFYCFALTP